MYISTTLQFKALFNIKYSALTLHDLSPTFILQVLRMRVNFGVQWCSEMRRQSPHSFYFVLFFIYKSNITLHYIKKYSILEVYITFYLLMFYLLKPSIILKLVFQAVLHYSKIKNKGCNNLNSIF